MPINFFSLPQKTTTSDLIQAFNTAHWKPETRSFIFCVDKDSIHTFNYVLTLISIPPGDPEIPHIVSDYNIKLKAYYFAAP